MESTFDSLVRRDFYNARKLYHGTTASSAEDIENNGINLLDCRGRTDFNAKRGFYVTADFRQAELWSRSKAKKSSSTPAVVVFEIDRQRLNLFEYKRFNVGEYQQWLAFTSFSRDGHQRHKDFDMVEGPYRVKALNGTYTKPAGHQLGIFSTDVANYFNDHVIRKSTTVRVSSSPQTPPSLLPLLQGMRGLTLQRSNYLYDNNNDDGNEDKSKDDSKDESRGDSGDKNDDVKEDKRDDGDNNDNVNDNSFHRYDHYYNDPYNVFDGFDDYCDERYDYDLSDIIDDYCDERYNFDLSDIIDDYSDERDNYDLYDIINDYSEERDNYDFSDILDDYSDERDNYDLSDILDDYRDESDNYDFLDIF